MTEAEALQISKLAEHSFRDLGWNDTDIRIAVIQLALTLMTLRNTDYIPLYHEKYAEVLRVLANCIELSIEKMK